MLKPGSGVYYFSRNTLDGDFEMQEGTLMAFDRQPEGSTAEYPPAQIAFLHPERVSYLSGSNWRAAFDRVSSVPYGPGGNARHYYVDPKQETFAVPQPSAADLDAVAAEQEAKEATSSEPAPLQETGDAFAEPEPEQEEAPKPSKVREMKPVKPKGR